MEYNRIMRMVSIFINYYPLELFDYFWLAFVFIGTDFSGHPLSSLKHRLFALYQFLGVIVIHLCFICKCSIGSDH